MSEVEYSDLVSLIGQRIGGNSPVAAACADRLRLSLTWTAYFFNTAPDSHCGILIRGSYGAAVEAVSLIAMGLLRPAVLSLRSHYELSLQFLYYRDHPVEWRNVVTYRSQPALPGVNKKYLKDNFWAFEDRFKFLESKKTRAHSDCYDVLSGVAHGTALNSITQATKPQELVEDAATISQAEAVFHSASEFLSDVHVSCFESNWLSLPEVVQQNLSARFAPVSAKDVLKF